MDEYRTITIMVPELYAKRLEDWASVSRTLRTAQNGLHHAIESPTADPGDIDTYNHCIGELDQIIPALDCLHQIVRDRLYLGNVDAYVVNGRDMRGQIERDGQWVYPRISEVGNLPVFKRLPSGKVLCLRCADGPELRRVEMTLYHAINVIPYTQRCHECGRYVVKGWPCELFPRKEAGR